MGARVPTAKVRANPSYSPNACTILASWAGGRGRCTESEGVGVPDQAPLMAMRLRIIDVMVIEEGSSVEHNSLVGEFARVDLTAFI